MTFSPFPRVHVIANPQPPSDSIPRADDAQSSQYRKITSFSASHASGTTSVRPAHANWLFREFPPFPLHWSEEQASDRGVYHYNYTSQETPPSQKPPSKDLATSRYPCRGAAILRVSPSRKLNSINAQKQAPRLVTRGKKATSPPSRVPSTKNRAQSRRPVTSHAQPTPAHIPVPDINWPRPTADPGVGPQPSGPRNPLA